MIRVSVSTRVRVRIFLAAQEMFWLATNVFLHLERAPHSFTHTGISFENCHRSMRFDFRAFNHGKSCLTSGLDRSDPRLMFPDLYEEGSNAHLRRIVEELLRTRPTLETRRIRLGTTKKSFREIEECADEINTRYVLGIYDCRHFVANLWSLTGEANGRDRAVSEKKDRCKITRHVVPLSVGGVLLRGIADDAARFVW